MTQSKPVASFREFRFDFKIGDDESSTQLVDVSLEGIRNGQKFHVIEYGAVEAGIDAQECLMSIINNLESKLHALESENNLLKRSEICGYCDFDNSLRKERDALESENKELKSKIEDINKNCISLFLHEQRMAQVDEQLKDFQMVVDFYAHWINWSRKHKTPDDSYIKPFDTYLNECGTMVGGKLARAMQRKWGSR